MLSSSLVILILLISCLESSVVVSFQGPTAIGGEDNGKCSNGTQQESFGRLYNYLTGTSVHSFNETLTIGFLTPYNENQLSLGAIRLAVERVNNDSTLLPGRKLQFIGADIGSSDLELTSLPIRIMTEMRDNGTIAFIGGSEDSCVSEALVAAAWNLPLLSYKCSDYQVSDKEKYSTFGRTLPPSSKVSKSVVALLKRFNWSKVVLVVSQWRKDRWHQNWETFKVLSKLHRINITLTYSLHDYIPEKFSEMEKIVADSYDKTRVYVFMGEHVALVDFVKALDNKKLLDSGDYIIISIDDKICYPTAECNYIEADYLPEDFVQSLQIPVDSSKPMMDVDNVRFGELQRRRIKAFRSVLKIQSSYPRMENYSEIFSLFANYSADEPFCVPYHPLHFAVSEVPIEAAYLYDAVMIYARALTESLAEGVDPRDGISIYGKIRNRSYHSIQGFDVFMDGNGDAEGNYTVLAMLPDELPSPSSGNSVNHGNQSPGSDRPQHKTMSMRPVGYFVQTSPTDASINGMIPSFQYFDEGQGINWVGGKPPKAEPPCGFRGEHCVYKPDWRTIIVCSIFSSVLAVASALVAKYYRYEQKLACLLWKIEMRDVIMIPMGPPEPHHGTRTTVALCKQILGSGEGDAPLEFGFKKAFTQIGFYKGMIVAVKPIRKRTVDLTRNIRKELKQIREFRHENIIPFIGASVDTGTISILTAYSARGSLEDVLQNEDLHLDNMFLASLVADLIKGMIYLHDSEIISHGNLKSSNCLVDSRWVLQIADFGLHEFKAGQEIRDLEECRRKLLWRAPELLRDPSPPLRGTQKGDVYSFGIILYELIGRAGPWGKTQLSTIQIIERVAHPEFLNGRVTFFRPTTLHLHCGESILNCMTSCWEEDPDLRPDFRFIRVKLKEMQAGLKPNIFDNMLSIMEKYACNLEDLVQERTMQLMEEKKKTDALLHRMLPTSVAESLKRGEPVEAESFDSVTIYFSDIQGFTALSAVSTPFQVVELLNDLYTCFDSIISHYDVYKVETIGDAYMVVSGCPPPLRNGKQHAGEIASMALHLLDRIQGFEIRHRPGERLKLRIGIHSGPVVAGVVGLKMPRYCLFGDTVNTASRMESSGEPLRIHISDATKSLLETLGGYFYEERGIIPIKGKGEMRTYWLTGEDQTKTRRNSTESNETPEVDLLLNNNNLRTSPPKQVKLVLSPSQVVVIEESSSPEDEGTMKLESGLNYTYKPTTWLLSECIDHNPKKDDQQVSQQNAQVGNGRFLSCSSIFSECKVNILKELKKSGSGSGTTGSNSGNSRFRCSAPVISFTETGNPGGHFPMDHQPFNCDLPNYV